MRTYDAGGTEVWTRQFGSASGEYAYSVGVGSDGRVLVAGSTNGTLPGQASAGSYDAFVRVRPDSEQTPAMMVLAGELFAVRPGGRPRHDDVARAMGGEADAEVGRLGFMAFDVLDGGDAEAEGPFEHYADRLALMRRLLDGGKRVQAIKTDEVEGHGAVRALYASLVDSGKAEGLVLLAHVAVGDGAYASLMRSHEHLPGQLVALLAASQQFGVVALHAADSPGP